MLKKAYKKINLKAEEFFPETYCLFYDNRIFVKYFISGVISAIVNLLFLYVLTEYLFSEKYYLVSVIFAFFLAFFTSFFLQKFWTFKDNCLEKIKEQIVFYSIIALIGLITNLLFVMFLVEYFKIWYFYSQIIAGALIAFLNFVLYSRFVFGTSLIQKNSILLASGIFPPDVGGPSVHSFRFLREFNERSIKTAVVAYSDVRKNERIDGAYEVERVSRKLPFGIRHFFYFLRLMSIGTRYDTIYAQDISAAGLPAVFASIFLKKRFFIRIGGDLLWERLAEVGKTDISVVNFYKGNLYRFKPLYYVGRFVLANADRVIVPSNILADIYEKYYFIPKSKLVVIPNPIPDNSEKVCPDNRTKDILFAGRFVKYKNLRRLISVFANIHEKINPSRLILVGEGPEKEDLINLAKELKIEEFVDFKEKMTYEELINEICRSFVCIAPSYTEFNPNFILEAISLKKPILITRENGLSIKIEEEFMFDPKDELEMGQKVINMFKKERGEIMNVVNDLNKNSPKMSWDDIIRLQLNQITNKE